MNGKIVLPAIASIEMSKEETQQFFEKIHQHKLERQNEELKPSPYLTHADKIFGCYSTAIRLQNLILHLYNSKNKCDLGGLVANADVEHRELALEIIRRYSILGENDQDFMETANQIQARRKKR